MRGAAFIGGEGPDIEVGKATLGPIDLIVAADSGLVAAESWNLHPDWIVGDMDSIDELGRLDGYPDEKILVYPIDKDYTDTELAIELLRDRECDEIVLVGGGGGRLDHTIALLALFDRDAPPNRWITSREDVRLVETSHRHPSKAHLEAVLEPNSIVSLFPAGEGPWKIKSKGLKWPLDELSWCRGSYGISNIAEFGSFSVQVLSGRFLVILPLSSPLND